MPAIGTVLAKELVVADLNNVVSDGLPDIGPTENLQRTAEMDFLS